MSERPPIPFALGMMSVCGSPPFLSLVFDDGAAVSLHSVRPLAIELGLVLPDGTLFDLLQDWDRTFPALASLVNVLAYDDRARGHRSQFVAEDLLFSERLLPEARQIIRVGADATSILPHAAQVGASSSITLDEGMQQARANLCLGAVIGRMCRHAGREAAASAIAGWTLATELVRVEASGFARCSAPGSLVLGPLFVPAAFTGDLRGVEYMLALMAAPVSHGDLGELAANAAADISLLSEDCLLLPGDVVILGPAPSADHPEMRTVDTLEAVASGFGRQIVSLH